MRSFASCRLLRLRLSGAALIALAFTSIALSARSSTAAASKRPSDEDRIASLPATIAIPSYAPGPAPFHIGEQLTYRISWIGIPAAQTVVTISNGRDAGMLTAEVCLATNRFVDLFYTARDYLRENLAAQSFAPRDIYIHQRENKRINEYTIDFDQPAQLVSIVRRRQSGAENWRFRAAEPYGPISGAMTALSQPLEPGAKLTFDIFLGRQRGVIDLHVERREQIRVGSRIFDAIRIRPAIAYLSDESVGRKARDIVFWVSGDSRHIPLRIEAAAFIGKLRADLVSDRDESNAGGRDCVDFGPPPPSPSRPLK